MRELKKKKKISFAPIRSFHLCKKKKKNISFALFLKLPGNDILP